MVEAVWSARDTAVVTDPSRSGTGDGLALSVAQAAARVGLTASTLRTWDRRYGLTPSVRTAGGHRRYNAADIARLRAAANLVEAGHPAAEAVRASSRASEAEGPLPARAGGGRVLALPEGTAAQRGIARAAQALDAAAVTERVAALVADHGVVGAWEGVIAPVLAAVGARWERTGAGVDVEHVLASGITAGLLRDLARPAAEARPVLLACAPDEEHVLPLLALHAALLSHGTPSVLLGARVPAEALADAVGRLRPRVVGLWAQAPRSADPSVSDSLPITRPPTRVMLLGPGWGDQFERPGNLAAAVAQLSWQP